jgi:hypothetical protein
MPTLYSQNVAIPKWPPYDKKGVSVGVRVGVLVMVRVRLARRQWVSMRAGWVGSHWSSWGCFGPEGERGLPGWLGKGMGVGRRGEDLGYGRYLSR